VDIVLLSITSTPEPVALTQIDRGPHPHPASRLHRDSSVTPAQPLDIAGMVLAAV
jgi:hypothetical protein